MTETPAYPGYAIPVFTLNYGLCLVTASPWREPVGKVRGHLPTGWVAVDILGQVVGLFPDKQAAGEALVTHAGYEVLR